jgi:hypothetical protein
VYCRQEEETIGTEEEQYHAVELSRGTRGFGFSIRGGREFQNMPLFVLQIAESGPAATDGRLKVSYTSMYFHLTEPKKPIF